jgi:hypothetical protein
MDQMDSLLSRFYLGPCIEVQSDEELQQNLTLFARATIKKNFDCPIEVEFGLPNQGGRRDRQFILETLYKDFFAGGALIRTLGPVMAKGLTG